jgi:beta-hydroxyacyl-ACP dehydratase FabZ
MIDVREVQSLLPHRYPFLLVDRILEVEPGKRIVGIKNVTINEPFFQGHFPGQPIMPGVLIIEAMAQVGGVLVKKSMDIPEDKLMFFLGIDRAKFRRPVLPGDQMRLELEVVSLHSRFSKVKGKAFVEGALVAEAELTTMIVDRNERGEDR